MCGGLMTVPGKLNSGFVDIVCVLGTVEIGLVGYG